MQKKHLFTLLFSSIFSLIIFAQDKIFLHNGKDMDVKIIKVSEFTISYSYPNETAEQTIGKYAVGKIKYSSGREEKITDKILVSGKDDWEKVMILEKAEEAVGLKSLGEVDGKTSGMMGFHTAGSADKKSMKKLLEDAAEKGAQFVLITADKDNQFTHQSKKRGVAYSY
jgi:sRNA-binding regulator protein Hfq